VSFKTLPIAETYDGVSLTIHVQPNAKRTQSVGWHGDALKIRLASPPIDGAANEALCRFLSRQLDVPMANVIIRSGHSARRKRIFVREISRRQVMTIFKLDQPRETPHEEDEP
jgi:uncharacterized protein (TIGR00251 family)